MKINLSHPLCPEALGKKRAMQLRSSPTRRTWRPPSRTLSLTDLASTCATTRPWIALKEPLVSVPRHRATQLFSNSRGFEVRDATKSKSKTNITDDRVRGAWDEVLSREITFEPHTAVYIWAWPRAKKRASRRGKPTHSKICSTLVPSLPSSAIRVCAEAPASGVRRGRSNLARGQTILRTM